MNDLSYEELVYRLDYDLETGEFTWINPTAKCLKTGNQAGTIDAEGYLKIRINNKVYYAHRLAWLYMVGEWPSKQIDHINGNKFDNRWCNLRLVSNSQNSYNRGPNKNNTSGEKGVYWHQKDGLWEARVKKDGKGHSSYHKYWWQAVRAARQMREKLHGSYHRHE